VRTQLPGNVVIVCGWNSR